MKNVREVRIGWEPTRAQVQNVPDKEDVEPGRVKSILSGGYLETLRITLTNGKVIELELFERFPGELVVRGDEIVVRPGSGNQVNITHAKPTYSWPEEK